VGAGPTPEAHLAVETIECGVSDVVNVGTTNVNTEEAKSTRHRREKARSISCRDGDPIAIEVDGYALSLGYFQNRHEGVGLGGAVAGP
jgi:hypothetical protein